MRTEGSEWVRPSVLRPDPEGAWLRRENTRRRVKYRKHNAAAAIDNPGLPIRPWMKLLGLWIAQQPRKPKKKDLLLQARFYSKARITTPELNRLLLRKDFQRYVEQLMGEEEVKARALFQSQMVPAITTHFEAMQKLAEQGEYQAIAKFTAPYIDRAYPLKREGDGAKQNTIVINLGSSEFAKRYLEPRPEDQAEEIVIEAAEVIATPEDHP